MVLVLKVMCPQSQLLEIIAALHPSRRLAGRLHRRQQQRNQNPDDRDDHQEFHQRKTPGSPASDF